MDRRALSLLLVAVVALASVVNATVFAYRWLSGTVIISPATAAVGAACTGFYSAADQSGITQFLPKLGTNYDAQTYGGNKITVTPGKVVCQWTDDNKNYYLYESIEVSIPVTVGSWYIQDFYAFGYNGTTGSPTVYVYFRVEDTAEYVTTPKLIIWKGTTTKVELNLLTPGAMTSAISLSPGEALRLDLYFNASSTITTVTATFRVGVYVTQEPNESPSP